MVKEVVSGRVSFSFAKTVMKVVKAVFAYLLMVRDSINFSGMNRLVGFCLTESETFIEKMSLGGHF